ncbi:MAG: hypothetical protein ACI93R_003432 [Flavobacteriales bacterium]|jgi:hypothetical protein
MSIRTLIIIVFITIEIISIPAFSASIWDGSSRFESGQMPQTPSGNTVAISCHNCYSYSANFDDTAETIQNALDANVDLIELDVVGNSNGWSVSHGGASTLSFDQVLAIPELKIANQILFIEIKQTLSNTDYANQLLLDLNNNGYFDSNRITVIRSFNATSIATMRTVLSQSTHASYADKVKLSLLYWENYSSSLSTWKSNIETMINSSTYKVDMLEFNHNTGDFLTSLIDHAKVWGSAVNIYTLVWPSIATYRDQADALTMDGDLSRARVEAGGTDDSISNAMILPLKDGFEGDVSWNSKGNFVWSGDSGRTSSSSTGPNSAAEGSQYFYMETSAGYANRAGNTALLESSSFDSSDARLNFKYHMFGSDIGTLAVDVFDGIAWTTIWSLSGEQHSSYTSEWTKASISLDQFSGNIKLRFRGVAAGSYRGDIAIDDLKIHNGIEILNSWFDGTWYYTEWTAVSYASDYVQFVVGDYSGGKRWLYRRNAGATNRGDYVYQYYHRDAICDALGVGTFELYAQVWPGSISSLGDSFGNAGTITCD